MKMSKKGLIYLVNAGNDKGMSAISNDYSFPHLGVLALGTWLKRCMPQVEVIARDNGVIPLEKVKDEIQDKKPDIVGISVLSPSYQNSLEIARAAKETGSYVVFGNDQAAQLGKRILERREYVDFIVGSEYGEKSLELLVRMLLGERIDIGAIPNLVYRKHDQIHENLGDLSIITSLVYGQRDRRTALDIFPIPDRTLYPPDHWRNYLKNYLERFSKLHEKEEITGVTTMNRARGCSRAKELVKCRFCDMFLDPTFSSPEMFWLEVKEAHYQIKANIFYEVCDSFSSFPDFIKAVAKAKPKNLDFDPKFFVYAQALDIARKPWILEAMKEMGVFRVNIGLEAGSDVTLKHMKGKHDSVEINTKAIEMLKKAGIYLYGSLVLGSDVETKETLRQTLTWAKTIIENGLIADIEAQPLCPLPNNYYGKKLRESGLLDKKDLENDWPWDINKITKFYIDRFSGVSYLEVIEAVDKIRELARLNRINCGSGLMVTES